MPADACPKAALAPSLSASLSADVEMSTAPRFARRRSGTDLAPKAINVAAFEGEAPAGATAGGDAAAMERRVDRALLPALCCLAIANYLDRTATAFAAAGMRRDLGLTLGQYGTGSSLLFATYCGAQAREREREWYGVGARRRGFFTGGEKKKKEKKEKRGA